MRIPLGIKNLEQHIAFLEKIINTIPVHLYIYQIENINEPLSGKIVWSNMHALNYLGYSFEDIEQMGASLIKNLFHPDDIEHVQNAFDLLCKNPKGFLKSGYYRVKSKNSEYRWLNINYNIFDVNPDGSIYQLISTAYDISRPALIENQLIDAVKEITQVRNYLRIKNISKREKEVLQLITKGLTDKEIAETLFISERTAQTHRHNIIKKTKVKNTAALVTFAIECGLN